MALEEKTTIENEEYFKFLNLKFCILYYYFIFLLLFGYNINQNLF